MATRQLKMPAKGDAEKSPEPDDVVSQRRRPERGRVLAPGRPANQGLLHHSGCRSIGGFGDQDRLSDRSGVGVRRRRQYHHDRGSTDHGGARNAWQRRCIGDQGMNIPDLLIPAGMRAISPLPASDLSRSHRRHVLELV